MRVFLLLLLLLCGRSHFVGKREYGNRELFQIRENDIALNLIGPSHFLGYRTKNQFLLRLVYIASENAFEF